MVLGWMEFAAGAAFLNYHFLVRLGGLIPNPNYGKPRLAWQGFRLYRRHVPNNLAGHYLMLCMTALLLLTLGRRLHGLRFAEKSFKGVHKTHAPTLATLAGGALLAYGLWAAWGGPARFLDAL